MPLVWHWLSHWLANNTYFCLRSPLLVWVDTDSVTDLLTCFCLRPSPLACLAASLRNVVKVFSVGFCPHHPTKTKRQQQSKTGSSRRIWSNIKTNGQPGSARRTKQVRLSMQTVKKNPLGMWWRGCSGAITGRQKPEQRCHWLAKVWPELHHVMGTNDEEGSTLQALLSGTFIQGGRMW